MRRQSGPALIAVAGLALAASAATRAEVVVDEVRIDGVTVNYRAIVPDDYDAARAWPAILVFGGGPQTMRTIEGTFERNFAAQAEARGYIVIGPAAPEGQLFFRGGDIVVPEFLDQMLEKWNISDGRFHVAGPSNGGIAAMHIAARFPDYFRSVTAFPGYLWEPTEAKLRSLRGICVYLYIGENDEYRWHGEMAREAEYLRSLGSDARYQMEPGQPHRLETLAGDGAARLFAGFEAAEQGCLRP
jgi:poly(3-hydroxybutyrate) depolymerase